MSEVMNVGVMNVGQSMGGKDKSQVLFHAARLMVVGEVS